ncbi:putative leucine-rich repeat-containing protein DDB_G0290503 [Vespa mandarinia]|uniref:putative leucine-rich repeat-containing protein DDB_G0290503 n=1 Tax=Vespa mandarinia TaxID=7446 RepID=UPI001619F78B|nr:putative leucine-rich repeat-containing protein DDB_G0290503 [Vespa mandarinia]XP_035720418.1 putative leucine-rich repeat-containing protein DDB_G0290503 [Vespa mandarinia]XP_035720419.1 putative leucine-rich repeat-containing protein DDB_G0290503 [Vespa mandarinia]XP_035720420.1 putative leucine-rich repeat-containing protein DDB_G0290503 [Vespa mandarinia]XP_035720421.1 putative leucine-rich repeat-containing protein DDB_G0290503 [Vespa mandarinia]
MEQVDTTSDECINKIQDGDIIINEEIVNFVECPHIENVVKVSTNIENKIDKDLQSTCKTVLSDDISNVQTDTKNIFKNELQAVDKEQDNLENGNEVSIKENYNDSFEVSQNTIITDACVKNTDHQCAEKSIQLVKEIDALPEKSVEIDNGSNLTSIMQCNSTKSSIISEEVLTDNNTKKNKNSTVCTILDITESESANIPCDELLDSLNQVSNDKEHSLHETVKQISKDDDNQNNSIVMDAELNKLVEENTEVVVVTVETIPVPSDSSKQNTMPIVLEERTDMINEKDLIATNKEDDKNDYKSNDLELINYHQEDNSSVIEVISTEIVQSKDAEICVSENKTESIIENELDTTLKDTINEKCHIRGNLRNDDNENENISQKNNGNTKKQNILLKIDIKKEIISETHANIDKVSKMKDVSIKDNDVNLPACTINAKSDIIIESDIASASKRSVIQDIFDDWGVENPEEENQSNPKVQDSVEIELKSLLDDPKNIESIDNTASLKEQKICSSDNKSIIDVSHNTVVSVDNIREQTLKDTIEEEEQTQKKEVTSQENPVTSIIQEKLTHSLSQNLGKSTRNVTQDSVSHQTVQCNATTVKNRNRHLTSQIVSPAEVTEVLKERLREKQKIVEAPRGPDIFFVKKITQRLSSKLAGGSISSMPALIPLPHPVQPADNFNKKDTENNSVQSTKEGNSDNKELLAILEGDVDPDWSNLKPPTLIDEGKTSVNIEHNELSSPPKLDPSVERELALKQLLELPVTPLRKSTPKRKKPLKSGLSRISKNIDKNVENGNETKEIVNIDLIDEDIKSNTNDESSPEANVVHSVTQEEQRHQDITGQDVRSDESRSGRKRKPTEKAREHEQSITKRQKVYKGKVSLTKKSEPKQNLIEVNSLNKDQLATDNVVLSGSTDNEGKETVTKEVTNKQFTNKIEKILRKAENSAVKRPKQSLTKKGPQPIAPRKMLKLMRQKMTSNKKSVNLKTKLNTASKKSKRVTKPQKRTVDSTSPGDSKPKKKIINEIDRLLQDEGVVNLLYDVEQPDKKRLVPITKSQAKVMDLQKVQRELKIRKKLVRNAVLRLRTTTPGITKVSPRSTRTTVHSNDSRNDQKTNEQSKTVKPTTGSSPTEFIYPAKIRNAADASIIIRRHSSSSFSSASGSPRVSIDGPDKQTSDSVRIDEGSHSLRSMKRRHSQEDRMHIKRNKKREQKYDTDNVIASNEDKTIAIMRPNKKSDMKRPDKSFKQMESLVSDESNNGIQSKVITRSNGAAAGKVTSKSRKTAKSKVTFAKGNDDEYEDLSKEEDELSACLAEAATALSIVSASNRSGNITMNRKNKVNPNIAKILELTGNKTKIESRCLFSNKEINVRKHGYLVQLILTPSSSTKIRNALTLQVMHELRETLSILKKDDDCRVVLLTSTGTSFCEGLELSTLLHPNKEERRLLAQEMADAVKDFIKSLATFNKPIVAGVQGAAIGLGVTMLPLFDLVIASDKATFNTPYGKLGQIAEGAAVFTLSHILGSAITSELLLGGRTLTASEALRAGLVTRVLWPDRFQVELLPSLKAMSEQSSQSMEATKALLRHSLRKKLDAALESETYLLIQHWCSTECQLAIKAYIDGKIE